MEEASESVSTKVKGIYVRSRSRYPPHISLRLTSSFVSHRNSPVPSPPPPQVLQERLLLLQQELCELARLEHGFSSIRKRSLYAHSDGRVDRRILQARKGSMAGVTDPSKI